MADSLRDRYVTFIDQVIADTLKGKFRSKRQVYDVLAAQLETGTSEMFERCLLEITATLQQQSEQETDELKQAKLTRKLRAIKTLQGAWDDWQKQHQAKTASTSAVQQILQAEASERLATLFQVLDTNRGNTFNRNHLQQLATELNTVAEQYTDEAIAQELQAFATGLTRGISAYVELETHLVSWIYDRQRQIGFGASTERPGPWKTWATHTNSPLAKSLFTAQAENQPIQTVVEQTPQMDVSQWVELAILLQGLQRGVVTWFDAQPYDLQAGQNLSGMTFLAFTMLWGSLSVVCGQTTTWSESDRQRLSRLCFAITLQTLRSFAQRDNFPLYGGVFTSFSGEGFQDAMDYLDQPLQAVEQTQEKARILTVLGYSQRWLNRQEKATTLFLEALTLAQEAGDRYCEVANLNHLARLSLYQMDYSHAINLAQRALIVARSNGDRQGEANALASVGYGEVMQARQQEALTPEQLELPLNYLQQGKTLAEKLQDSASQAFCCVGLGIAYLCLQQPHLAQQFLEPGIPIIQQVGDLDLRAIAYGFLGEVYYQLEQSELAVVAVCLGMYWLHERANPAWRQAAALATILQGQLGEEQWSRVLQQHRSKFLTQIGADGFDYLPKLLEEYRSS